MYQAIPMHQIFQENRQLADDTRAIRQICLISNASMMFHPSLKSADGHWGPDHRSGRSCLHSMWGYLVCAAHTSKYRNTFTNSKYTTPVSELPATLDRLSSQCRPGTFACSLCQPNEPQAYSRKATRSLSKLDEAGRHLQRQSQCQHQHH